MADMMTFPETVEEFMEQYRIIDTGHVYTNGAALVPIFRMEQWFEHQETAELKSRLDDAISNVAYILDVLWAYKCIDESGCCNDCKCLKGCGYLPSGQLVRYNCPFYERGKQDESD